jgi:hypothetical protein
MPVLPFSSVVDSAGFDAALRTHAAGQPARLLDPELLIRCGDAM